MQLLFEDFPGQFQVKDSEKQIFHFKLLWRRGEFLATTAAVASYAAMAKGISALEEADIRHWTTLPQAFRMEELRLPPGNYQLGVARYVEDKTPENPSKILTGGFNGYSLQGLITTLPGA